MNGDVKQTLRQLRAPDENAAQARAWKVISAAYRDRSPAVARRSRWRLALLPALTAVVAALTLTPAGATVTRLINRALGVRHASPALLSLPAPGRLLVSGAGGTWTVSADGSRRHLGAWRQASWSPHGLYIAAAGANQLAVIDPRGHTQWTLARPAVADPRWYAPTGFRIAYRSGHTLRIVAGNGTGDHQLAAHVAPVAPAWRPDHPYQLAYALPHRVLLRDADTGRAIWTRPAHDVRKLAWSADGHRLLVVEHDTALVLTATGRRLATIPGSPHSPLRDASLSPDGRQLALVLGGAHPGVFLAPLNQPHPMLRSALPGADMQQAGWLPNGRWLLVGWPGADQWVFVAVNGAPKIAAVSHIAQQFTVRSPPRRFPHLDGWCCTTRGPAE